MGRIKKTIKIILTILALTILVGACIQKKGVQNRRSNNQHVKNNKLLGIAAAFTTSNKPRPVTESDSGIKKKYSLEEGEPFSGNYLIYNGSDNNKYGVIALLDYKQVPFELDGKKAAYHEIAVKPQSEKFIPFRTNPIAKGFHDYSMIAIWEPDNHSLDKEFRMSTDLKMISKQRANLIAGSQKLPSVSYGAGSGIKKLANVPIDGIIVNKSADDDKLEYWVKEEVESGQKVKYYVHVGNVDKIARSFAVIALLDYKQVPIKKGGPIVAYGMSDPKTLQSIKGEISAPKKKGVHELLFLFIANPFSELPESGQLGGQHFDDRIEPSARIPIVVK